MRGSAIFLALCLSTASGQEVRIYYDTVEADGRLSGGRITADLSNAADRLELGADLPVGFRQINWPVTTLFSHGPSSNRVDIVLLGDGYQDVEMGAYAAHVDTVLTSFLAEEPIAAYLTYFNVHRVDVTSVDSGVDEIDLNIFKNTALDMAYGCFGIDRLLCINVSKAAAAAASAPAVDQILALANSTRYGGAGYPDNNIGTLAGNNGSAVEIALHEFGHSFADLADEYHYSDGATYNGFEPVDANISIYNAAVQVAQERKWFRWMDLPNVDAFQGAGYHQFGLYRPTFNSKMRSLNRPFEQVNVEQFVMSLYQSVSPVDDASPVSAMPLSPCDPLFVVPLEPVGHNLQVRWSVNGSGVPGATGPTFLPTDGSLVAGLNTVSVIVRDTTTRVRDEEFRDAFMTFARQWQVSSLGASGECACVGASPAVQEPAPVDRNRYIAFEPNASAEGTAIRVTLVELMRPDPPNPPSVPPPDYSLLEGQVRWVGPPQLVTSDGNPPVGFYAATLQCEPSYFDWNTVPLVYVTGTEIVPSSLYSIQVLDAGCNPDEELSYTPELLVSTGRWGDVAEPFQLPDPAPLSQPNVLDASAAADHLKGQPGAALRPRVQVQPAVISITASANVLDVSAVVDALKGIAYPYPPPAPCWP